MGLPKPYFTVADLEKILGLKRASLYVTLSRLVKAGILVRLRKNAYKLFLTESDLEKSANELYFPSYLSFESALSKYGILSQIPYTLTFATTRPSKKIVLGDTAIEYRHMKGVLFFGYILENGRYIATPEKALLDELYLMSRGKTKINIEELDLKEIDSKSLKEDAIKFPAYVGSLVDQVKQNIGTTPATLETGERIRWKA
jgi:hypothetical protein